MGRPRTDARLDPVPVQELFGRLTPEQYAVSHAGECIKPDILFTVADPPREGIARELPVLPLSLAHTFEHPPAQAVFLLGTERAPAPELGEKSAPLGRIHLV